MNNNMYFYYYYFVAMPCQRFDAIKRRDRSNINSNSFT